MNPLDLPSDTDLRFVLLILAVLAASTFAYTWIHNIAQVRGREYVAEMKSCARELAKAKPGDDARERDSLAYLMAMLKAQKKFSTCLKPAERARGYWISACLAFLLGMAWIIYGVMPRWRIWRRRLKVPSDPKLSGYLTGLASKYGIRGPPTFLLNLHKSTRASAFGNLGRKYVMVNTGLIKKRFSSDLPAFRAVVLHELAHLRNKDVDKTYFTVALLLGFAMFVLLPLAAGFFFARFDFNFIWRMLVLATLVIAAGIGVLRAREFHADARVCQWEEPEPLKRALTGLPTTKSWWRLLHFHPTPKARLDAIKDPAQHPLLHVNFWEAFATGLAAMAIYLNTNLFAGSFLTGTPFDGQQLMLTAVLFLPVAIGIVGLGVWRSVAAGACSKLGRLAMCFALGLIAGEKLAFQPNMLSRVPLLSPYGLIWSGALVAAAYVCLCWVKLGASAWLETQAGRQRFPRYICTLGLALAGLAFAGWFSGALTLRLTVPGSSSVRDALLMSSGLLYPFLTSPLTAIAIFAAWAYPLASLFRDARSAPVPPPSGRFRMPLDVKKAILFGIAGGVSFTVVLVATRFALRELLSEETLASPTLPQVVWPARLGVAILVASVVSALVARRVRGLPVIHGLAAAYVSGCIGTVGWLSSSWFLFHGSDADVDWTFARSLFTHVVNGGAVAALLVAFLARRKTRATPEEAAVT